MRRIILVVLLPLVGCSVFEPAPDSLEAVAETLHTPDMNDAIRAAKPGEPSIAREGSAATSTH
jgi:hypothetical protein